jgi:hypothetical protein
LRSQDYQITHAIASLYPKVSDCIAWSATY